MAGDVVPPPGARRSFRKSAHHTLETTSEQRLAVDGGDTQASAWRPGGRTGLERGLDGGGDELRGPGVDGDVPAEQHAANDLPGVPGRVLRGRRPCQPSLLR
jgi:hypothetical protein